MIAVLQRVKRAVVIISGEEFSRIGEGLVVLVGIAAHDTDRDVELVSEKIATMRLFSDQNRKMNRSILDVGGEALIVSQFTLLSDVWSGRRPSFSDAAAPDLAKRLYEYVIERVEKLGVPVKRGVFGAMMEISLTNDGPVTVIVDTQRASHRTHFS